MADTILETQSSSPPSQNSPQISNISESVIDPSHELFLHHSDHPNYSLASRPLDGENYNHGRRAVEVSLMAKNKLGFVKGSCKVPDSSSSLYSLWERCNSMVISWLLHSISGDIAESVVYCTTTAYEIWKELEERFGQANGARIYQIQRDLCQISQGCLSVSSYFSKFKKLWDEYSVVVHLPPCNYGSASALSEILQNQRLMQFLMGLNDSYKVIRAQLILHPDSCTRCNARLCCTAFVAAFAALSAA